MADKIYYYIKLEDTYFGSKFQKALRSMPAGADMLIVYLKMQLRYARDSGYITYDGLYPSVEEEIAQDIDENVDVVRLTLAFMKKYGYFEHAKDNIYYLPEMQPRIGSKTDVAIRVEKHRALKENKQENKLLQCNKNETIDAYNSNSNSSFIFSSNYFNEYVLLNKDCLYLLDISKEEYDKLVNRYGIELAERAILCLNSYLLDNKSKQKQYTSHYRVILKWVIQKVQEDLIKEQELQQRENRLKNGGISPKSKSSSTDDFLDNYTRLKERYKNE